MKKWFKNLPVLLLSMAILSACGENTTGGKSSKSSGVETIGSSGYSDNNQNYGNMDEMRSEFNAKSLSDGVGNNDYIYHIGNYFNPNASQNNSGGTFNVSGCINIFGFEIGDCQSGSTYDPTAQLQLILDRGRLYKAVSSNSSTVNVDHAYSVINGEFIYQADTFDRNSSTYREMLGLEDSVLESRITSATITLANNTQIAAKHVELFLGTFGGLTGIKRFVVTTNLPVVANPVFAYTENASSSKIGALAEIGNVKIQRIQVNKVHYFYNGQIVPGSGQTVFYQ